jgi:hypothetical protein
MEISIFTPETLGLTGGQEKASSLDERPRAGANVLVKLICVLKVNLSTRVVVWVARFLVRCLSLPSIWIGPSHGLSEARVRVGERRLS